MSILGHKTLAEAERCTRAPDQAKLATAAVLKLEGRSANRIAQTLGLGLGKKSKMEEESK
jgi:enterobacteria phage integrase